MGSKERPILEKRKGHDPNEFLTCNT